jgi:NAD(P)H-hydrate epimerase
MMSEPITSAEMNAIDRNCAYFGLSSLQLMENAGAGIANTIKERFDGGKVTIIAGKGNNGGDAFVAGRHLKNFDVEVMLMGRSKDIGTEEARINWKILSRSGCVLREIRDSTELRKIESDIILDAIFGTGIKGEIREPESTAIDIINESDAFVVSVDVPSGLDSDTGIAKKSVRADLTLTFHRMKKGLISSDCAGEVKVIEIGIPLKFESLAGPGDVLLVLNRKRESHKGENGRILIVGGGVYFGAPTMSAFAALRSGADIVTLAVPKSISGIVSSFSPNLIVRPLGSDIICEDDVPIISDLIRDHDVTVIGMGIGNDEETIKAVKSILSSCKRAVIDADGLYALELPSNGRFIITPHAGEFAKMGIKEVPKDLDERLEFLSDFSGRNRVVTLMKGRYDIISDGSRIKINESGNAGMTVGGTGDVLAGIVGAIYATTEDRFRAATAATFLNGTAGDAAFKEKGYGFLATDVIDKIPGVLKNYF